MAQKAFYQTFFQTEALFRLPDDPLSFGQPEQEFVARLPVGSGGEPVVSVAAVVVPSVSVPVIDVPTIREPAVPTPRPVEMPVADVPLVAVVPPTSPDPVPIITAAKPDELPVPESVAASPVVELPVPAASSVLPEPLRPPARPVPTLQHRVLIVVADVPLPGELLFLQNVLKAVHLDADMVDLLNLPGWEGRDFGPVLAGRQIDQFLIFGLDFTALGLDIELDAYHPVRFDGITYLRADAPGVIEGDRALKKRLWESLKRVFLRSHPQ